jgi:hypothetical protein
MLPPRRESQREADESVTLRSKSDIPADARARLAVGGARRAQSTWALIHTTLPKRARSLTHPILLARRSDGPDFAGYLPG